MMPYQHRDMDTSGVWFRSERGLRMVIISFIAGIISTVIFVLLDEYWLDLPGWLPFLPGYISNGWIPLAALLLVVIGFGDALKFLGYKACESRQSIFTFLLASFITLTIIGIFFRGEGMALILPWG